MEKTADLDLGHVVNAAFIYDHIKSRVIQSGVLLQEIAETIAKQTQEDDGELRLQLCALIFLIGQLPHGGPNDAGIRANAETLADLMVTDLTRSSTELRKRVPELLEKLVASGTVLRVENEYRMQTKAQQVKLPSVTIKNEDDLKTWLATVEATIRARLNDGPVIV